MERRRRTEYQMYAILLFKVLLLPITLIRVIFGRLPAQTLFEPIDDLLTILFQPRATIGLMAVNCAVYVYSFAFSEELFSSLILFPQGILQYEFLPLITSGFLHASHTHLFGNMLALYMFGRIVEEKFGSLKTLFIYFGALIISGLFTSVIHILITQDNTPGLGASGAIMGLVATAILINPFYLTYELLIPIPVMVAGWLAVLADITGILNPTEDGIGHIAHLGGFISIAIIMYFLNYRERKELTRGFFINIFSLILLGFGYTVYLYNFA